MGGGGGSTAVGLAGGGWVLEPKKPPIFPNILSFMLVAAWTRPNGKAYMLC